MKVPLEKARICLECDTIHDLPSCPECGSASYYYLANWIKPHREPRPAPQPTMAEAPPGEAAPPRKKRRLVRNVLLAGVSLLTAYTLLFKPRRKPPESEE